MDKFAPENRLRDHVAALAGRQCSQAELTEVMRLVRLVVENEGLAETYPHVSLYRDWLLHPEIDRHKLVLKKLEQMNEAIARYDQTGDIAIVSALFSLAVLPRGAYRSIQVTPSENRAAQFDSRIGRPSSVSCWKICAIGRSASQRNRPEK